MDVKSPKTIILAGGLIKWTLSIFFQIAKKTMHKDKEVDW